MPQDVGHAVVVEIPSARNLPGRVGVSDHLVGVAVGRIRVPKLHRAIDVAPKNVGLAVAVKIVHAGDLPIQPRASYETGPVGSEPVVFPQSHGPAVAPENV